MKPLNTLIRTAIVGLCWSIFFLEGIRVILLTNWHFDLIDSRHWRYLWDLWMSGWMIDDKKEWAFILIILSFIPLWLTGWAALSLIKWEYWINKYWKKFVIFYKTKILNENNTSKKQTAPAPRPMIKRKKSYKEIRPRNLSSMISSQSENTPAPSPIAANRTLPNVKPITIPSAAPASTATTSILDHSLFKFDDSDSDFELNFDDLDKIQNKPKETPQPENKPKPKPEKNNNDKNNRSKDNNKDNKESNRQQNKPIPMSGQSPAPKNSGNSSMEVLKQKGYQIINSATIKNNFVDFIGVADGQICICLVDKESGDWLADEERFNDEEPLWFSENSHRVSPVRCADIVRNYLTDKLQESGINYKISTYVIIQYGNIINAEDMFETWNNMHINVTRIDRGMPRELKLFAKTLDDAENSINIEQFEKIKKLVRNLT